MRKREISIEDKLIFQTAKVQLNNTDIRTIRKLFAINIDWEKVLKKSQRNFIQPFLYYSLNKLQAQKIIPPDIFSIIKNCYYTNITRNTLFLKELSALLKIINSAGIKVIVFKGVNLLKTLYHNHLGLRALADIDILIQEADSVKIKSILIRAGYQEAPQRQSHQFSFTKKISWSLYLLLDVHRLIALPRPHKINIPHLWERVREEEVHGQHLYLPSLEDTFLSLVLHLRRNTQHLFLKFIIDIAELLRLKITALDWNYIENMAKKNHIKSPVYFAISISHELFNAPIPQEFISYFRPNYIKEKLLSLTFNKHNFLTPKKWEGIFLRLLLFDSPIDFLPYLWRVFFLERLAARWRFKNDKKHITKRMPIDPKEKIKK